MTEETKMIIEGAITESIINAARDKAEKDLHTIAENIEDLGETESETWIASMSGDDKQKEEYKKLFAYAYKEYIISNLR